MTEFEKTMDSQTQALGFSNWGATGLSPASFHHYESWIQNHYHGDMKYLENHLPIKEDPRLQYPLAKSALVLTYPYFPNDTSKFPLQQARVASYAKDLDYHFLIKAKLNLLIEELRKQYPQDFFDDFSHTCRVFNQ